MVRTAEGLVGRERERVLLRGAGHVQLVGEAGIGKTSLLHDWMAAGPPVRCVSLVCVESKQGEPMAAITTLVSELIALDSTLHAGTLLEQPNPTVMNVGFALLQMVDQVSDQNGLHIVVDDAHWMDDMSAAILAFVRRRVPSRTRFIVAMRPSPDSPFNDTDETVVSIEGLDVAETAELLGDGVTTSVAAECQYITRGNPLALLGLSEAMTDRQRSGSDPLFPVSVGSGAVTEWMARRVQSLPTHTHLPLAAVVLGAPRLVSELASLLGPAWDRSLLGMLEETAIVRLHDHTVELCHPLMSIVVRRVVGDEVWRAAHLLLAQHAPAGSYAATWHFGEAAPGPDESVAKLVEEAGHEAMRVGARNDASAAFERAAGLSMNEDDRARRLGLAGWARLLAENYRSAIELLEPALEHATSVTNRAVMQMHLGEAICWHRTMIDGAQIIGTAADVLDQHGHESAYVGHLRAGMHFALAGDVASLLARSDRAGELATTARIPQQVATSSVRLIANYAVGDHASAGVDAEKVALLRQLPTERIDADAAGVLQASGVGFVFGERHEEAEWMFTRAESAGRRLGLPGAIGFTGAFASEVLFRQGRFAAAITSGDFDVHRHAERGRNASFGHAAIARAQAAIGHIELAKHHAQLAYERAERNGIATLAAWANAGTGFALISEGRAGEALAPLLVTSDLLIGFVQPSALWFHADLIEALFANSRTQDLLDLADDIEDRALRCGTRWGIAMAARARGLAKSNRGEIEASMMELQTLGARFELARSTLLIAEQFGDQIAAVQAASEFERMGAEPWARRAVMADGDSHPEPSPSLSLLTTAELRVVAAASTGRTSKEIAQELYLSTRTVDAHLRSIYRRLDLKNRSSLVAWYLAHSSTPPASFAPARPAPTHGRS